MFLRAAQVVIKVSISWKQQPEPGNDPEVVDVWGLNAQATALCWTAQ